MTKLWKRVKEKRERGASMTEYIIMIVILAIAIGFALVAFRDKISSKVEEAGSSIEGMEVKTLE